MLQPRCLCVKWGPSPLSKKGAQPPSPRMGRSPPPQFSAHIYCGQTAAWIKMPLGTEVGLGADDIVLGGDPALPFPKRGRSPSPIFGPCLLWPNGWMDQDGTRHRGGSWSRSHCARWGPSARPQKWGRVPQFYADFSCGQTAGCINMPLGMEVGFSPGDFVLDGDPARLPRKGRSLHFSAHVYCR